MKTKSLLETNRTGFGAKRMKQLLGTPIALALVILANGCAGDGKDRTAGQSIDDAATSRRVLAALNEDTAYKYPDVKVATYQGKVQLSGFVDKDEQKDHANDVAKKTQGVKGVRNDIVVK
jgi:osmotically-inducible protein OsmY